MMDTNHDPGVAALTWPQDAGAIGQALDMQRPRTIIEHHQRLSESTLWQRQRSFFEHAGPDAWGKQIVPHYVTSNAFIADSYARVVRGFLDDCARQGMRGPVHIVELGAGAGRFAYHFLKRLGALLGSARLEGSIAFRYVMTDFNDRIIDYWRNHASLVPFVEMGVLDFARFDVERDLPVTLLCSGDELTAAAPMVVIANYVFDGVPHDLFHVERGELHECLVTLTAGDQEAAADDLSAIDIELSRRPVSGDYYQNPLWNRILDGYRSRLASTTLSFPTAALSCLERLRRLSNDRLLFLSADKGYLHEADMLEISAEAISEHGSISMAVNYHAIAEYVGLVGGTVLPARRHRESLTMLAFLLGFAEDEPMETRRAFDEAISRFGPDDFFTLKQGIEATLDQALAEQMVAYVRLSCWDYKALRTCLPYLIQSCAVSPPSPAFRHELRAMVRTVWEHYYPISKDEPDLAFSIGLLLVHLGYPHDAMEFFLHSIRLHGNDAAVLYNIAICAHGLAQHDVALRYLDQALELAPEYEAARSMRLRITSER